uniref:Uncharacterized protein n=1 Tax=Anguilla anguilla TaxID=7936 RepID=A0A0E9RSM4_ANGAN
MAHFRRGWMSSEDKGSSKQKYEPYYCNRVHIHAL